MIQSPAFPQAIIPWLQLVMYTGAVVGVVVTSFYFLTRKKKQDQLAKKQIEIEQSFEVLKADFQKSDFLVRTELQTIGGKLDKNTGDIERETKEREKLSDKLDSVAKDVVEIDKKVTEVHTDVKHLLNRRPNGEQRDP